MFRSEWPGSPLTALLGTGCLLSRPSETERHYDPGGKLRYQRDAVAPMLSGHNVRSRALKQKFWQKPVQRPGPSAFIRFLSKNVRRSRAWAHGQPACCLALGSIRAKCSLPSDAIPPKTRATRTCWKDRRQRRMPRNAMIGKRCWGNSRNFRLNSIRHRMMQKCISLCGLEGWRICVAQRADYLGNARGNHQKK